MVEGFNNDEVGSMQAVDYESGAHLGIFQGKIIDYI